MGFGVTGLRGRGRRAARSSVKLGAAHRLPSPARLRSVRGGALTVPRDVRAMTALALADVPAQDAPLREHYRQIALRMLAANLGRAEDGSAMAGLIAFRSQGLFAAAT